MVRSSGTPEASAAPPPGSTPGTTRTAARHARPAGEPGREPTNARRLLIWLAITVTTLLIFVVYLMVSRTYPENSDEANILLMASDMLHGNVLLHGWYLSDVSFYTTELPQYALLERLIGLHADTAHVAAAMTYTLVVLMAALLARGVTRPGAWPRVLLTTGIMFAPQLGVGVFVLLLSVGHIGTAVPLMLTWLVIDFGARARGPRGSGGPRGFGGKGFPPSAGGSGGSSPRASTVPPGVYSIVVWLLLTWVLVADQLVLVIGIVPLVAVCAIRVSGAVIAARRSERGSPGWLGAALRARQYEVFLAAAAILAYGAAALVNRLLRASGGFILHPVGYKLAPLHTWLSHARVTGQGLLALFGAWPQGPAIEVAFAVVHLAGVALVAWAIGQVARRFLSWPDLVSQILLVAIVVNVLVYVPSTLADATDLNAREFAIVLPFGAVLAGRTLATRLLGEGRGEGRQAAAPWRAGLAAALLAGYAASLGYAAAQPSAPPANLQLASFLAEHHLTEGVGGYWLSSIVTVDSDGSVTVRAVLPGNLQPDSWESKPSWYDPASFRPTFLVTDSQPGFFHYWKPNPAALAAYGPPAHTYHVGPYTVFVWDKNLLKLAGPN